MAADCPESRVLSPEDENAQEPTLGTQNAGTSLLTAWWWLVILTFRRIWWSLQSLLAVLLLGAVGALVVLQTLLGGWTEIVFARNIIGNLYLGFMLPLLCLAFGTQALGGDWEDRTLVWLLTRPLPRPLIYLAKFVAAVPWTFGLTLGGLLLLGALGGPDGLQAVRIFWPAVAWGTMAYLALFVLLGAWFRRSTIIGVVYSFVIESLMSTMPGMVKRASIAFYSRCIYFQRAHEFGLDQVDQTSRSVRGAARAIAPDRESLFMPISGDRAILYLCLMTAGFLILGTLIFARREYKNLT
jgi:ABC-type transport system involved in multi-copper enzyme maturation permease subunit